METPKVSIIMPVYNAEKYLNETIDSVLNQTYDDFEFLIIDDGSTDRSLQILNSYNDPRLKVFKNGKNIGYVKTLNKLLELSKGEYIARQDNDDISFPNRIEKQVHFLNSHKDIGICGTNVLTFGTKKKKTLFPIEDYEIRAYMIIKSPFCHPTIMFRKSIFDDMGVAKYDESLCPAEDYAMWFEISKKTKLANLSEPLLKYRWHENNTSQLKKNIQIEKANTIRKHILQFTLLIDISDEEASLLNLITFPELITKNNLIPLEQLLIKLLRKNKEIGYYQENNLQRLFFYFWTKVCYKAQDFTLFKRIKIYVTSDIFSHRSILNLISIKNIHKIIYDQNI
jgi:glycosyltransferase involved in cell wall biosynthesis